jgi:uncharacterized damage-inducible protein DinB
MAFAPVIRHCCAVYLLTLSVQKPLFMKKFVFPAMISILFAAAFSSSANCQSLTTADIKAQMIKDWERAKAYTIDYLNTMPADKYSFRPVDSIRSFAQQMLHLAGGNVFLMMSAANTSPLPWLSFDMENRTSAQSKDSVMYYVATSYDYCLNAVKNSDVNKWGEKTKMFNTYEMTRWALMNKTFEHQDHHRGQTTIYIRLNGIKPPQERLF